jgi:hypothetical protein
MEQLKISKEFIQDWSSRYGDIYTGGDDADYELIKDKVHEEISESKTISRETFTDIIDWKSARTKGKIDWDNFQLYQTAIKYALELPDELKLSLLCGLDGIEVPVGSTVLHFIYPDTFPIVDYRVTAVLYDAKILTYHTISKKTYRKYKATIENIIKQIGFDIRTIDRALFSYHKLKY